MGCTAEFARCSFVAGGKEIPYSHDLENSADLLEETSTFKMFRCMKTTVYSIKLEMCKIYTNHFLKINICIFLKPSSKDLIFAMTLFQKTKPLRFGVVHTHFSCRILGKSP